MWHFDVCLVYTDLIWTIVSIKQTKRCLSCLCMQLFIAYFMDINGSVAALIHLFLWTYRNVSIYLYNNILS